jgi:hypothetical protein
VRLIEDPFFCAARKRRALRQGCRNSGNSMTRAKVSLWVRFVLGLHSGYGLRRKPAEPKRTWRRRPMRFRPGQIVATPGALEAFRASGVDNHPPVPRLGDTSYAAFFCCFTLAHLARCAAAIFRRADADMVRFTGAETVVFAIAIGCGPF